MPSEDPLPRRIIVVSTLTPQRSLPGPRRVPREVRLSLRENVPGYLDVIRRSGVRPQTVVLLLRADLVGLASAVAEGLPDADIHVLSTRRELPAEDARSTGPRVHYVLAATMPQRLDYLARIERPQVILEAGDRRSNHKLSNLRNLFYALGAGGVYLMTELDTAWESCYQVGNGPHVVQFLTKAATLHTKPPQAREKAGEEFGEFLQASATIAFHENTAAISKSVDHLYKLREWEADEVLDARYGATWGESRVVRPARSWESRATVSSYGSGPIPAERRVFEVPPMRLRHYRDVVCPSFQIAVHREHVLPDSFRHLHQRVLAHRHLIYASSHYARLKPRYTPEQPRHLTGHYYLLDTEHPGHFGHITTEVLARYWGWRLAVAEDPTLRPLVSAHGAPAVIPTWQQQIFAALEIPLDQMEVIHPRDVVSVERLTAATPQFENPYYIDPEIADTWQRLRRGLVPSGPASTPAKIFISRREGPKRNCYETQEVERFFAEQAFFVCYPEDLPFVEQARLFAGAKVIAGFGGSGMFTMLLAPQARIILLSGDGYNAQNEHLIAAVNGNDLHYFWGPSDLQTADGFSQLEAARSDFHFPLPEHRQALLKLVS